jgi:sodium transport system permease protein
MNLTQSLIVCRKELLDSVRDRRALIMLPLVSIAAPLMFGAFFAAAAGARRQADELVLPVAGAEHAPALVAWLTQQTGLEIVPAPADPAQAVRTGVQDVVLMIDEEFGDRMSRALPAPARVVRDGSRDGSSLKAARVRALIDAYGAELLSLRLMTRGVAPAIATPVYVEDIEVSSARQRAARLLIFLPTMLGVVALIGGIPLAIDSTTGERERGSLESLLMNPVSSQVLVTGKWLAASTFACGCVSVATLWTMTVFRWIPWHEMGVPLRLQDQDFVNLLVLMLPMAMLMSALLLCLFALSRSFKEAMSYIGFLMLIPTLPGLLATLYPLSNRPWLAPVPFIGQFALASDVLAGREPAVYWYGVAAIGALAAGIGLVALTARLLRRESVVFGG